MSLQCICAECNCYDIVMVTDNNNYIIKEIPKECNITHKTVIFEHYKTESFNDKFKLYYKQKETSLLDNLLDFQNKMMNDLMYCINDLNDTDTNPSSSSESDDNIDTDALDKSDESIYEGCSDE